MTYIIHPMWFYLIGVSDKLIGLALIIAVTTFAFWLLLLHTSDSELHFTKNETKHINIVCSIVFSISILLFMFLPSESTGYKMLASSIITVENVQKVHDSVGGDADQIVNMIVNASVKLQGVTK